MFSITSRRYHLYRHATDMRKSFDELCGLVQGHMQQNPCNGDLYIFINKQRNRMKLLRWEPGSFVLFYKRLEKGTFELPQTSNPGVYNTPRNSGHKLKCKNIINFTCGNYEKNEKKIQFSF